MGLYEEGWSTRRVAAHVHRDARAVGGFGNSWSIKVLACVVEGVALSGRRQPALIGESVGMPVRHHTALQAILDELC